MLNNKHLSFSFLFTLITILGLAGCAESYVVSTNLDSENFENYFGPGKVTIYQDESEFADQYFQQIGLVEGQDCQEMKHHAAPDDIRARTDARLKAYKLGANGIIFSGCALVDQVPDGSQCVSTKVCYGIAYKIEPKVAEEAVDDSDKVSK